MSQEESILVVGGAGYIGAHAAKALSDQGYRPIVFDDLSTGHAHNVKWGPFERGDVRDSARLRAVFSTWRPRAVMHFAAKSEVAVGEANPASFYDNNVAGSLALFRTALEAGVEEVIFSSSCAVYGPARSLPIDVRHPCEPTTVYGRTKRIVEMALEDLARASGLRFACLRYFNAAGADPGGEIGEEHDPETHLIPNALRAAFEGSPVTVYGQDYDTRDGSCIRDFIHVNDLAEYHVRALAHLRKGGGSFSCNLGSGVGHSVFEVLEAVERASGTRLERRLEPRRPGDLAEAYADAEEASALLGYKAVRSDLSTMIGDAWRFHRARWSARAAS